MLNHFWKQRPHHKRNENNEKNNFNWNNKQTKKNLSLVCLHYFDQLRILCSFSFFLGVKWNVKNWITQSVSDDSFCFLAIEHSRSMIFCVNYGKINKKWCSSRNFSRKWKFTLTHSHSHSSTAITLTICFTGNKKVKQTELWTKKRRNKK